ncbi:hypothetical protein GF325_11025 [Candidatus Bathyarchaeota archaeon]|nr:hypothetical protein [Candidatus Bathyarchaeota archaeon]
MEGPWHLTGLYSTEACGTPCGDSWLEGTVAVEQVSRIPGHCGVPFPVHARGDAAKTLAMFRRALQCSAWLIHRDAGTRETRMRGSCRHARREHLPPNSFTLA